MPVIKLYLHSVLPVWVELVPCEQNFPDPSVQARNFLTPTAAVCSARVSERKFSQYKYIRTTDNNQKWQSTHARLPYHGRHEQTRLRPWSCQ